MAVIDIGGGKPNPIPTSTYKPSTSGANTPTTSTSDSSSSYTPPKPNPIEKYFKLPFLKITANNSSSVDNTLNELTKKSTIKEEVVLNKSFDNLLNKNTTPISKSLLTTLANNQPPKKSF